MTERLKTRRDFRAAARGAAVSRPAFLLQVRRREDDGPARIGFTVSRRAAAKAVERNRIRRRLKEAARRAEGAARPGCDYVLVARSAALRADFARIVDDVATAMREGAAKRAATPPPGARSKSG
jgi:ribonuclease P protein component